ncbi:hypothetical protein A2661_01955 [Candidatus Giovannonibacteria bacterium RIFCSPHIGHO2_01_FULL_45_24]|uniref:Uncharacterized protein n=1 Tax=Candidatus Giovannonibacteria bacterium RIFCSPLOWO2_01_FULL_46_32 TaxID=1798353 RepID=A0A1F5XHP7_9BACT|nr:MAG: hypothetical protein A2661_01955 [Candidatus Giovannonibacteria bacterium RIFCSPHIGHO2_01_FULL_45_24]OGF87462.1 MAG: hypothetical protein A3B19_02675 [Candidatus Giovannonibacteria bacterium RIFCSPLOWO2_01_FULL_46_32]
MERGKERLDPKEEAKKTIDSLLNDYGEYPDVWLSDEEKKAIAEHGSKLAEKQEKWRHNKYAVASWLEPVIGYSERILELIPDEKDKQVFTKMWEFLLRKIREEQTDKISKETVEFANKFLLDLKNSLK